MVSPRKRVLSHATATPSPKTPSHNPPFGKFRFFLDLKTKEGSRVTSLREEIRSLGGGVEEFFSSAATHVITDCNEERLASLSSRPGGGGGPPSPWTPSPATPASPASTRRPLPSSRAEAILSKVRQPAKVVSVPVGLLEKAVQLGIQIWSYTKTVAWLGKYRAKYGSAGRQPEARRGPRATRQLLAPCIKLENCDGSTRPVFSELKAWPSLHFDGRPGASPFSVPSARQRNKKLARRLDVQLEPSARKKENQQKAAKKVRGYCEICNTDFENLEAHLVTELHLRFVNVASNWAEVDQFVSQDSALLL